MKFLRITALAGRFLVVATVAAGAGTSYAEPAPPPPIGYEVNLVDKTIVTTLDNGKSTSLPTSGASTSRRAGNTV